MSFFRDIANNQVFIISVTAWFVAQVIKVLLTLLLENKLDASRFVGSGGMPSSHSSFVTSLATAIGIVEGYDSVLFAMALVLALIVMYDAANVRRAVGKQAKILNALLEDIHKMFEDIHQHKKIYIEKRLKELIGHTPIEVLSGALLGIIVANLMI
ncbi:hypothetical protein EAL2_c12020 [Peptoclostridium acidaminophilum DSM 3953]|uniref:Divergent PAP2 family protein n=1 Tax=Peptoclostridium acidaminophilum DSM 3953 TaxID=1286171 RepID=W8TJV6_PEPAC|nr:divergent PAP2 family protein [Peptoclostridium acidaminophilum]AHM56497.1 hypothetical protein EAL2_c12020 [Peptoclostridium acidaminophilum DSM 3953]